MSEERVFQYFYRQNECKARFAQDDDCICWFNEGVGPFKNERYNLASSVVEWRVKPAPTNETGNARPGGE